MVSLCAIGKPVSPFPVLWSNLLAARASETNVNVTALVRDPKTRKAGLVTTAITYWFGACRTKEASEYRQC